MKWKVVVPVAIILAMLALALTACGPDIKEEPTTTESEQDRRMTKDG